MLHSAFSRSPTALFYKDCYEFVLQFPALAVQDCSVIVGAVSGVTLILNCVFLKEEERESSIRAEKMMTMLLRSSLNVTNGSLSTPYPESAIHHCALRHRVSNSRGMIDLRAKPGNGQRHR
uniref:Uncharacterized protein n=1 Tax=Kalanchoe fedtschenkoi TaxID=63787 RepID=A0A7N0T8I4_KALFE